mmetsp:Transcript_1298/g.1961  ORF Transcript_1298/g.1961 Transcript_1298/m.1961 type:complete len:84 (-) Transcript_1298:427-678(-)
MHQTARRCSTGKPKQDTIGPPNPSRYGRLESIGDHLHEASFRIYTLDKFLPPHLKHARRKETRLVSAGFSSVSTPPHSILAVS